MNIMKAPALDQIIHWFDKTSPHSNEDHTHKKLAKHLEKISGMLISLKGVGRDYNTREQLSLSADVLNHIQRQIKAGHNGIELILKDIDTIELLQSLCDQIITSIGVAHALNLDITGALSEVAECNISRFDEEGNPIFNEQMNLVNGPGFIPANLTPYI
jgi:hypothetical protein